MSDPINNDDKSSYNKIIEILKEYNKMKNKAIVNNETYNRNGYLPISDYVDCSLVNLIDFDLKELTN